MPLREDILNPIAGANPGGQNLRLSPVYDRIREARREDDSLAQGAWQHERKAADHALAAQLAQEAIASQSKDLQLAAWLCDSLLKADGVRGLREGLDLCNALLDRFWESLYPEIEDGELEDRAAPFEWLASKLLLPVQSVALCGEGYSFLEYQESRGVEYEESAKTKDQKAAREKALKEGKLAPEAFDKSFAETAKRFYADLERQLDDCLAAIDRLDGSCTARFGLAAAPSFSKLQETLQSVRRVAHQLLQKKRDGEPDRVESTETPARRVADVPIAPSPAADQPEASRENSQDPALRTNSPNANVLAQNALRAGDPVKAIEILQRELQEETSGRGRFQRRLELARVCIAAGKDQIAQPLLDDIAADIETHKLDVWEETGLVAGALAFLMQSSKKIQSDAKAKQAMFERICRLDPVQALSV